MFIVCKCKKVFASIAIVSSAFNDHTLNKKSKVHFQVNKSKQVEKYIKKTTAIILLLKEFKILFIMFQTLTQALPQCPTYISCITLENTILILFFFHWLFFKYVIFNATSQKKKKMLFPVPLSGVTQQKLNTLHMWK